MAKPKQAKPKQAKPKQAKPKQAKPKQAKPKQAEPKQAKPKQAEPADLMTAGDLMTANDVAKLFHASRQTLMGWVRAGRIPAIQVSRKVVLFDCADIQASLRRFRTQK